MQLLLDQGLPRSMAELWSAADIDTIHAVAIGYGATEDAAILQLGEVEGRIVVTDDAGTCQERWSCFGS